MSADGCETPRGVTDAHPFVALGKLCQTLLGSGLVSFCSLLAIFGAVGWNSYDAMSVTGAIGWYTTVVWSLPALAVMGGLAGGVMTAGARRRRPTPDLEIIIPQLLVVVLPTIGRFDTVQALERVVTSFCAYLPRHFTSVRVDIVIEESCEARDHIAMLANKTRVGILTVPGSYRTPNGTQFKARANHYAHEVRLMNGDATEDVWVLHMDDDTAIGEETARSLAMFIHTHGSAEKPLHLAQGVLSYPRDCATNRLTWLADAVRPGCDISIFAASTGLGSPRAGLHGEFLLVRASIEASIGWDFGPRSIVEDAEFALLFCERYPGRSGWLWGRCYGASPASVADFVRQRERWVWGLLELVTKRAIPLRQRLLLLHNVGVWLMGPFQHPALILLVGFTIGDLDTSPATVALLPLWTVHISFFVWLYWEGLKINAASSVRSRRLWWEPLALLVLLPLFSLLELAGVVCGLGHFLCSSEPRFSVISKPA